MNEHSPQPGSAPHLWSKLFLGVAVLAAVIGALISAKTLAVVERKVAEAEEAERPAGVQLIKITTPDCADCFPLEGSIVNLKQQATTITEEKAISYTEETAQALIRELGITRVPTYVLTGEVNKENLQDFVATNGKVANDKFVFTNVTPLYIDPITQKIVGGVTAVVLTDLQCTDCIDVNLFIEDFKKAGIKFTAAKKVEWNSDEGQNLIRQYAITKLPALVLSPDMGEYGAVRNAWAQIGTIEKDGSYVLRNLTPPYRDVEKDRIVGLVDALYLTDASCNDCYRPENVHKDILTRGFGIKLRSERTIDISSAEGKRLIDQYKISQVPTVLLSSEANEYARLQSIWQRVGTIEENGWYIFRHLNQIGGVVYKDLAKNEVIRPQQQPNTNP